MKCVSSNSLNFEKKRSEFIGNLRSLLGFGLNTHEDYILNSSETYEEYLKNLQSLIAVYESEKNRKREEKYE